jgi:hypothetical protein
VFLNHTDLAVYGTKYRKIVLIKAESVKFWLKEIIIDSEILFFVKPYNGSTQVHSCYFAANLRPVQYW